MSADPRFPLGKFVWPAAVTAEDRARYIETLASAPARLREAVAGLTESQLDTPYRSGGWTVRQVVHHIPDSHMNSYIRFKLALTEDEPAIQPYDEAAWAKLSDAGETPVEVSLSLLECLHARWVTLLRGMGEAEWKRKFRHPEIGLISLESNLALYAWHGDHHIGHITAVKNRSGW
ncbi:MAG: YfiT family bacillithiol transferase [Acidobacteriota bacterium]